MRQAKTWTAIEKLSVIQKSDLSDRIKWNFFQAAFGVSSTIWMHHMDADTMYGEKAEREVRKNDTCYMEQILKATSHETTVVRPSASYLWNNPYKTNKRHCGRSKEELISYVLLSYLPTPPLGQDMTQGQFLSGV